MPVERTDVEKFLKLSLQYPVLDVRSPSEFTHAHIPGAFSIPVFSDQQRALIGTAYVQQSRKTAVDIGLNYFSDRMKIIPGEVLKILDGCKNKNDSNVNTLLIHCWRGGMRSDAVVWLLSLYGYKIYVLNGGYKAYRRWVLMQFEKTYSLKVLGGFTGSGKTEILHELKRKGKSVIDLEGLANHKGSAFGSLGQKPQPSHEMFENMLAIELWKIQSMQPDSDEQTEKYNHEIWIEDESIHIGRVGIPKPFWKLMRTSPLYFLDIPFEKRLYYIVKQYGSFENEKIINAILKIQKRLGGLNTKNAIQFLMNDNSNEAFSILLKYYDKMYIESLNNRKETDFLMNKIKCKQVDIENVALLKSQEFFTP